MSETKSPRVLAGNADPTPPGSLTFSAAGGLEVLRFDPDGSIYIRGEKQPPDVSNEELRAGFQDWIRSHLSAVSLRVQAEQRVEILEAELRKVIEFYKAQAFGISSGWTKEAERLERLLNTTFYKDI